MDFKAKIGEIVSKLQADPSLLQKFNEQPVKTIESIVGVDLPDEQIDPVISGIKAKLSLGGIAEKLGGIFGGKK